MNNLQRQKNFRKIYSIYFVVLVLFVAVRIFSNLGWFSNLGGEIATDIITTGIIQIVIMLVLPAILYMILFKASPKKMFVNFGFKKLNFKSLLICFAIGILTFLLNIFISSFFNYLIRMAGFAPEGVINSGSGYDSFPKFLVGVLTVAILPAFCEEFLHRGLILRGTASTSGYKKAIVISSILFGLMHLNIQQVFYAAILGLLMGFIASVAKSIWPAIIVHFCNNFLNVYFSYAETTGIFGSGFYDFINTIASTSIILFFVLSLVVIAVCVLLIFWLIKKLFLQTSANHYNEMFSNIEQQIRLSSDRPLSNKEVIHAFEKYVFPNMKSPKGLFELFVPDNYRYGDISLKYKIPAIACVFLGIIITIFTFIWGCV